MKDRRGLHENVNWALLTVCLYQRDTQAALQSDQPAKIILTPVELFQVGRVKTTVLHCRHGGGHLYLPQDN